MTGSPPIAPRERGRLAGGLFITLEGIEGCGKTTQIAAARGVLEGNGRAVLTTREPGGTPVGRAIRGILLDPASAGIDPAAELLLYLADRVQHVRRIVQPALAAGKVVLSDRFHDATVVYQGLARGLGRHVVDPLYAAVLGDVRPDLTLLFDLPVEVGLARAWQALGDGARSTREMRFEKETRTFHQSVRDGYLRIAHEEPGRFRIIDADRCVEDVAAQVRNELEAFLRRVAVRDQGAERCNQK